jgi:hypothetical protein
VATTTDDPGSIGTEAVDLTTRVRRRVLPALHRIAEPLGGYAVCRQHPDEYVGTVAGRPSEIRSTLEALEFEREPIASLKIHDDGRLSAGSLVRRESPLARRQLHVTLFRTGEGAVELFAHREYSWLRHPYGHYTREEWDIHGGVDRMRSLLSDHGIEFRVE